jgi:mRNA interferase RelE/StbE
MSYELQFSVSALDEWQKLDNSIKMQLKKKLAERLLNPHIPSARLSDYENIYKIKLRTAGYRLVYEVKDDKLIVIVLTVWVNGKKI